MFSFFFSLFSNWYYLWCIQVCFSFVLLVWFILFFFLLKFSGRGRRRSFCFFLLIYAFNSLIIFIFRISGCLYRLNLSKYIVYCNNNTKNTKFFHLIKLDLAFDLITYPFIFRFAIFFSFLLLSLLARISSRSFIHSLTHLIIWFIWTMSPI